MNPEIPLEVTRKQLAAFLDCTPSNISKYVDAGMPTNGKTGKASGIPFKGAIEWVMTRKAENAAKTSQPQTSIDIEKAKAEKEYWSARREKYKALKEEKELVTVADSEANLTHFLIQIRDTVMTIENRWAPFLVMKETLADTQAELQRLVDDLLKTLSSLPDQEEEEPEEEPTEEEPTVMEDDPEDEDEEDE